MYSPINGRLVIPSTRSDANGFERVGFQNSGSKDGVNIFTYPPKLTGIGVYDVNPINERVLVITPANKSSPG